jgi:hypothetical protein
MPPPPLLHWACPEAVIATMAMAAAIPCFTRRHLKPDLFENCLIGTLLFVCVSRHHIAMV